jgi:predicted pyridoxine 5'-phosphate oxidase superfamily flavin-nucleotide-binding protein
MSTSGWSPSESPFHAGERAIQARLGIAERMDLQGRRIIRPFLTEQHRSFFAQLAYVLVGSLDAQGHPWASILVGPPGFLASPEERTLEVSARPLPGDPLAGNLHEGMDIGVLGIDLATRRRNRLNGIVTGVRRGGFTVQVRQSFGNCPQYIQARHGELPPPGSRGPGAIAPVAHFGAGEVAMITGADTFFIATAYQAPSAGMASGVDVSHRGGRPGFVRIDDGQTLTIPEFSGNNHFNTLGNLEMNPQAGLLFVDFERGDLLMLSGTAEVIWDGEEIRRYAGAERLLRFQLRCGYLLSGALPIHWSAPEGSPFLEPTGSW